MRINDEPTSETRVVTNTSPKTKIKLPPFHPLALMFPPMTDREYRNLVDNIAAHTQRDDIDLWNGAIIDGVHRAKACQELGIEPRYRECKFKNEEEAREYVKSKNIHRRHLAIKKRLEVLTALLKAAPGKSNRQLAKETKTDKATVAKVRQEMEDVGEIAHVETRTDSKGRQQPASKPKTAPTVIPKDEPATSASQDENAKLAADGRDGDPPHTSEPASKPKPASTFAGSWKEQKAKGRQALALEIERLASKLIENDVESARALHRILWNDERGSVEHLTSALGRGLRIDQDDGDGDDEEPTACGLDIPDTL
jgi:ParB-like chromosome segregation protein Spo0J